MCAGDQSPQSFPPLQSISSLHANVCPTSKEHICSFCFGFFYFFFPFLSVMAILQCSLCRNSCENAFAAEWRLLATTVLVTFFIYIFGPFVFYFVRNVECRQESRVKRGEMRSGHDPGCTTTWIPMSQWLLHVLSHICDSFCHIY